MWVGKAQVPSAPVLTLFSSLFVAVVCILLAFRDEWAEYPIGDSRSFSAGGEPRNRVLINNNEGDCDEIPMENIESTWEYASGKRLTVAATGMMVYQNGNKLFEEYEPANVCPIFCVIPAFRWLWNLFNQFGGSPTKRFSLFSGTKSAAGIAALMLVKQEYIESLDDKVSDYIDEWKDDPDKVDITIRELLTLSSGISGSFFPFKSLQSSIEAPFDEKQWSYSVEPFVIFGHIIQLTTGRSGWQYLDDEVFSVLDMEFPIGSFGTSGVTNFFAAGAATLPDMYKLAEELLAATFGEGRIFNQQDIIDLSTPGLKENYGLTFWLAPRGVPSSCDPSETLSLNIAGAFGQLITIFPGKRLIILKSAGLTRHHSELHRDIWVRIFDGVDCACKSER